MKEILKLDHIQKYYGNGGNVTKAIQDISFSVQEGEFVGIMGASGSGKTTLLNCISTIDTVSAGHIYLDGTDVTEINEKQIARFRRENLGFVFQDFNLLDTLTISENIALALTINKVPAGEIDGRVREMAGKLNITDILDKYPYQVSGGQKQRCACARAIINQPKLILADEPTGALDSHSSQALLSTIQISSDYIGMQSGYIGIQSEKELPVTDYSFLDSFIEKNISVRDDCSFKTYFVNKTDFYNQLENSRKNAPPITAISLSDYNHLLKMAGYDEISLRDHEFTTQWLSITPQDAISTYLEAHKSIRTDGGDLQLADISAHTVDLGEDFYNFQSVIYIVPDHICNKLTSANTFRYMMADKTISYDIAQELKSYFENSSLTDSLVTYNITMRTIEVNDNSAIIFIMQTGLTYSAIILFVTCFTILALQQLSDSGKYKYRFRVLRNMGVEEPHIRKLILKQLAVWFGVPVILALILAGAFLVFLIVGFHMQIAVYIGVQRLVQQLLIVLAILGALLISYFISTWVLFNKSASA